MAWKRKAPQEEMLAYRSEFAGMVGSMETMASSVVRREMVVFLQKTQVSTAPCTHMCTRVSCDRVQRNQAHPENWGPGVLD